jgi:hypothetical protein
MKKLILATFLFIATTLSAQDKKRNSKNTDVETACHVFDMEGFGCDLAVRIDGVPILWMEHR